MCVRPRPQQRTGLPALACAETARPPAGRRKTLAAMKRAQQDADEWAKIYEMHIRVRAPRAVAEPPRKPQAELCSTTCRGLCFSSHA
jgi:hypothetical protein